MPLEFQLMIFRPEEEEEGVLGPHGLTEVVAAGKRTPNPSFPGWM